MRAIQALSLAVMLTGCITARDQMIADMRAHPLPQPHSCVDAMSYIASCDKNRELELRLRLPLTNCYEASRIGELCQSGDAIYLAGTASGYAGRLCDMRQAVITDRRTDMLTCIKR